MEKVTENYADEVQDLKAQAQLCNVASWSIVNDLGYTEQFYIVRYHVWLESLVKENEGKIEYREKEELTFPLFTPASHFTFSSCNIIKNFTAHLKGQAHKMNIFWNVYTI